MSSPRASVPIQQPRRRASQFDEANRAHTVDEAAACGLGTQGAVLNDDFATGPQVREDGFQWTLRVRAVCEARDEVRSQGSTSRLKTDPPSRIRSKCDGIRWQRSLSQDLDRLQAHYGVSHLVSLMGRIIEFAEQLCGVAESKG